MMFRSDEPETTKETDFSTIQKGPKQGNMEN